MNQQINNNPSISIVMPLYNKEKDVGRAIASVLAQTISDFELLVVNDGSTDNGPEIVRSITDERIRIIDQENGGVSVARNRGIAAAQSDLIAFLDADDEWKPFFLETIFKLRKKFPDSSVFATGYSYLEQDGSARSPIINGVPPHPWCGFLENYFHIAAISDPPLWTSAIAVTREALTTVNGFPVGIKSGEDLLTWARLAAITSIAYDTTPCAMFWTPTSASSRPSRFNKKDAEDFVGDQLNKLISVIPDTVKKDFFNYIALWHTMRASTFIELGWNIPALKEIRKIIDITGYSQKTIYLLGLACLPNILSQRVHFLARKIRKHLHGTIQH